MRQPARRVPSSRRTSPKAFTATAAATVGPPGTVRLAKPKPPFMPLTGPPFALPTVAPVPAPTLPISTGPCGRRRGSPPRPARGRGRPVVPRARSKRIAVGTIGIGAMPVWKPWPWRASHSTTGSAAESPKPLPPASTTAWALLDTCWAETSESNWRVPVADPRTSAAASAPVRAEDDGGAGQSLAVRAVAEGETGDRQRAGRSREGRKRRHGGTIVDGERLALRSASKGRRRLAV